MGLPIRNASNREDADTRRPVLELLRDEDVVSIRPDVRVPLERHRMDSEILARRLLIFIHSSFIFVKGDT
jgi:hypothetical protein